VHKHQWTPPQCLKGTALAHAEAVRNIVCECSDEEVGCVTVESVMVSNGHRKLVLG
jgi:hypothetical protein